MTKIRPFASVWSSGQSKDRWLLRGAVAAAMLLAVSCGSGRSLDPPGDGSVAQGLSCHGDYPATRADYYTGIEASWYQAAQICQDCPDWPNRDNWNDCANRALAKFNQ
jgi:hypothetical protein